MARSLQVKAFEGWISGTTEVYSDPVFNSQLGTADEIRFDVTADAITGTTPALTVPYQTSNSGLSWETNATLVNAAAQAPGTTTFGNSATGQTNGNLSSRPPCIPGGEPCTESEYRTVAALVRPAPERIQGCWLFSVEVQS